MVALKIRFVEQSPVPREHLPPDYAQVYIGPSRDRVDMQIVRQGFIVADPVMHAIGNRIQQIEQATPRGNRSVAERVGLHPVLNAEWRKFLNDLLHQEDSWAFLVSEVGVCSLS